MITSDWLNAYNSGVAGIGQLVLSPSILDIEHVKAEGGKMIDVTDLISKYSTWLYDLSSTPTWGNTFTLMYKCNSKPC